MIGSVWVGNLTVMKLELVFGTFGISDSVDYNNVNGSLLDFGFECIKALYGVAYIRVKQRKMRIPRY